MIIKSVGTNSKGSTIQATLVFNNTDGSSTTDTLQWPKAAHNWMKQVKTIRADKDFSGVVIRIANDKEKSVAYFDDFKLTKANAQLIEQPSFEQDKEEIEYVYDAKGNRYSKTVTKSDYNNPTTRYYQYDEAGEEIKTASAPACFNR